MLVNVSIRSDIWKQLDFLSSDVMVIQLSGGWGKLTIVNVYNNCNNNNTMSVTILNPIFIFCHFLLIYSALLVTHSPLIPLRAAWTVTKSPDKSSDGSPDHSAVRYHMPSLHSLQHSTALPFNPLWVASL